ncbi:MAG TPA: metalloregulator ArsR/SmtB family transcription factor [Thermomicrobiales bacterium]|nr:metalloregulator ArsR/SmtB family transcription factor [Thermomicrobiales bacterium]
MVRLAQAIADPTRFAILRGLMHGSVAVAELVATTGATQSNVSNHLAVLRAHHLIRGERRGRHVVYRIADPAAANLVEALMAFAGSDPEWSSAKAELVDARVCYDHLAGTVGVALYDALTATGAIIGPDDDGTSDAHELVILGPAARDIFRSLGLDPSTVSGRRKFAYACRDWTERRFHLGGALGATLCQRLIEREWVIPASGRAVTVTPRGHRGLRETLGIQLL